MRARLESFADNLLELERFFPTQWEETIFPDAQEQLNPNLDAYLQCENNGVLVFIALKDADKLVGYFLGSKFNHPHSKDYTYVMQDSMFVHPDYRGRNGGIMLIKKLEEECRKMGVIRIFLSTTAHNDISPLFRRLNYSETEIFYSKTIGN